MNRNILKEYAEGKRDFTFSNLRGAYLSGAYLSGADLSDTDLNGADLSGADLSGADLRGADLRGADLRGADLRGADLRGADLGKQWIVQGPCRSDGYWFFLQKLTNDTEPMVKAGCRYFTLKDAREHWQSKWVVRFPQRSHLGGETFTILNCLEAIAKARGYI